MRMRRCEFCHTDYIRDKDDDKNEFICKHCKDLKAHIKNKDLFLNPLKKILYDVLNLELYKITQDTSEDFVQRIIIEAYDNIDYDEFCFMSEFKDTSFGKVEVFLLAKCDNSIWIEFLNDYEKKLKKLFEVQNV